MRSTILLSVIFILCFSCKSENSSITKGSSFPTISKIQGDISIDGHASEASWESQEWMPLDNYWLGDVPTAEDFTGKYKLAWDDDYIYVLAEIIDDKIEDTHPDGLDRYWDDDCLELFIDEDNSDGNHQFNHSAYAYHIAQDLRVTDIGVDSLPMYLDHHVKSAKVTSGNKTTWEVGVRVMNNNPSVRGKARKLISGEDIGFMVAYCDNDGSPEREHFIGSNQIEGVDKNRGWIDAGVFNNWTLVD